MVELDFLASSFLMGIVVDKSMKGTLSEEQVVVTHCCFPYIISLKSYEDRES